MSTIRNLLGTSSAGDSSGWQHGRARTGVLVAAGLGALLGAVGGSGCEPALESFNQEPEGEIASALTEKPDLWMPFAPGEAHRCSQGNSGSFSHDIPETKYGLDFGNSSGDIAVAALAGKVTFTKEGCPTGSDSGCGDWFGNHVKLDHGGQYYTLYGHLSSVTVSEGAWVGRGAPLGIVGATGVAKGAHLHFGLHQGNPSILNVSPSVPFVLRTRDATVGGDLAGIQSESFVCDKGPAVGHKYESDNECSRAYETLDGAKELTSDIPYSGEACAVGDVDFFYFDHRAGAFDARIESTRQSIFDCSCAIYDERGVELERGGPEGYSRDDSANGAEGCACSLTNASPDKHYLKVYAAMPGAYVLSKTLPPKI